MWMLLLFRELEEPSLHLRNWAHNLSNEKILALASNHSDDRLKRSLAVVDAKSLYDYIWLVRPLQVKIGELPWRFR